MSSIEKRKARRVAILPAFKFKKLGFGHEMPPDAESVNIYFDEQGLAFEAEKFLEKYNEQCWCNKQGTPLRNWKVLAADWIYNCRQTQKLEARITENKSVVW